MALKLGFFKTEQEVINTIETLERDGFTKNEIMVMVNDGEHSRRIESETDVHTDELRELVETRERVDVNDESNGILLAGSMTQSPGGVYAGGAAGMMGSGAPYAGMNLLAGKISINENSSMEEALIALGVNGNDASLCRDAIVAGGIVVGVETGSDSGNGGPDLTRNAIAESAFRQCGADRIV